VPCEYCTRILHTGEAKILVAFTVRELKELVQDTCSFAIQERLLKAIGLLDAELEKELRET
jgi:hypothetical protein